MRVISLSAPDDSQYAATIHSPPGSVRSARSVRSKLTGHYSWCHVHLDHDWESSACLSVHPPPVPRVRNLLGIIRGILFILIRLGVLSLSPLSIRLQVQFVRYVPNLLGIVHVAVRLLPSTQWRTSLSCFSTFACSRRSSNQSTELHGYAQDRIYVSTRPHSFSLVSVRFHSCVLGWGHYLDSPLRG